MTTLNLIAYALLVLLYGLLWRRAKRERRRQRIMRRVAQG